jgi:hypothetical protein
MQTASTLLMVRPACFGFNEETAANNYFQKRSSQNGVNELVLQEFDAMVELLRSHRIEVLQIEDTKDIARPDAIFPNNWFSCNEHITLFPMFAPNRRAERRFEIIDEIKKLTGMSSINDMSFYEDKGLFLEGTGSMVCDHRDKIIYACLSERTNELLLNKYAALHGYTTCKFTATDSQGRNIYHTNVMMCIGDRFAVVCIEAIRKQDQVKVIKTLERTGHTVIPIVFDQMQCFAGNMLQVKNNAGEVFLLMSSTAFSALENSQVKTLETFAKFIVADVPTIETAGGGSVRCMVAEIFY